jgi:hypothetical protein
MNFQGNFKQIGEVEVNQLKALVDLLTPEHWQADQMRQSRYDVHAHTQAIALVYDYDFRHQNPTVHQAFGMFKSAVMPIVQLVAEYYDNTDKGIELAKQHGQGYCIRLNLVRLNPGGEIKAHQDKNFSLAHSHRVHIPIISNKEVIFTVGEESCSLVPGSVVEINNRKMHSVVNSSKEARVHLIMDWVIAGEQCCCGPSIHPDTPCGPQACMQTDRLITPCTCFESQS